MNTLAKNLLYLRKKKDKTQLDISELLQINRTTYTGYEKGTIVPPVQKLQFLANYYNVSTDMLLNVNIQMSDANIKEPVNIENVLSNIDELTDGDKVYKLNDTNRKELAKFIKVMLTVESNEGNK